MTKIISMLLVVMVAVLSFATVGSAATITAGQIDAAEQMYLASSEDSADITVSAEIVDGDIVATYSSDVLAAATDAQVTIIIFDATTVATPSAGNMIQIDQFAYDSEVNTYTYEYAAEAGQKIVVMMGGTDIDNPGRTEIVVEADGTVGDVNGDEKVTMTDAIAVAYYTVNGGFTSNQLKLADFNNDGEVTLADAMAIAQATV